MTVQWEGSDKDNQARGNGCFWSTRRSTNGEEEAEEAAWEEVRVPEYIVCTLVTFSKRGFSSKNLTKHFFTSCHHFMATKFCDTLT